MACPYFFPKQPALNAAERRRFPLGRLFEGECRAADSEPTGAVVPAPDLTEDICNFGYGRGRCPSFPADAFADAVRFYWRNGHLESVYEKDWAPLAVADLPGRVRSVLARQTAACLESRNDR